MRPFSASLSYASAPGTRPATLSLPTLPALRRAIRAASRLRAIANSANEESELHAPFSGLPSVFRGELDSTIVATRLTQGEEQQSWDMEKQRWSQLGPTLPLLQERQRKAEELQSLTAKLQQQRLLQRQRLEQRLQALNEQHELWRASLQERKQILQVLEAQQASRQAEMTKLHRIFVHPVWIRQLCFRAAERINRAAQKDGQHGSAEPPAGGNPWDCSVPGWAAAWLKDSGDSVNLGLEEMDLTYIFSFVPLDHEYGQFNIDCITDAALEAQASAVLGMADTADGDSLARIFVFVHGCSADTV